MPVGAALPHVRFGSKADSCSAATHVRFTPDSGHQADMINRSNVIRYWGKAGIVEAGGRLKK
jgi:hypothetical protein